MKTVTLYHAGKLDGKKFVASLDALAANGANAGVEVYSVKVKLLGVARKAFVVDKPKTTRRKRTPKPADTAKTNKPVEAAKTNKPVEAAKTNKPVEAAKTPKPAKTPKANKPARDLLG
jgi:cell division protein FtsN